MGLHITLGLRGSNCTSVFWVYVTASMAEESQAPPVAESKTAPPAIVDDDSDPDFDDLDGLSRVHERKEISNMP